MPYVKPISGHGTTVKLMRYLTKEGRALAADYLNLTYDSRLQPGVDLPVDYNWSKDMDEFRHARGGDDPWKGRQARTFKHYIVSPDPKDNISIERLRELAVDWASENFGDYQVAIFYHDDNEAGIPHAHVVVNNMNVETGHRLQDPNPSALNRRLQAMADERGLSGLGIADDRNAFQRRADSPKSPMDRPATRQRIYVRKAEKEIAEKGGYSWISDIRSRVSTARSLAMDEREFMSILAELGVEVSDNSSRNARRDWVYSIADHPTWRITGERMGLAFGKSSIQARFLMTDRASPEARSRIEEIARTAIELADVARILPGGERALSDRLDGRLRPCHRRTRAKRLRQRRAGARRAVLLLPEGNPPAAGLPAAHLLARVVQDVDVVVGRGDDQQERRALQGEGRAPEDVEGG